MQQNNKNYLILDSNKTFIIINNNFCKDVYYYKFFIINLIKKN